MLALYLSILDDPADELAFVRVFEQFEVKSFRIAYRYLKSESLAQEAVQESWIKIAQHFKKFLQISCDKQPAWIVTIVRNTAKNIRDRELRYTDLPEHWNPPAAETPESERSYQRLVSLIRALPEPYRAVLDYHLVLEWSHKEIAQALGISTSAVSTRLERGRKLLMEQMKKAGYEYDGAGV